METKLIGSKIAEARKKLNVSQAQLAKQLFISPQAVGKWERGESLPDIITFNRLAEILGVDLNYFSENFQSQEDAAPESSGGTEQTTPDPGSLTPSSGRQVRINLTAVDLQKSDFAGVKLHNGKFKTSALRGADFTGADLTGSAFEVGDAREANFNGANLTDCTFSIIDLTDTSFSNTILMRTVFNKLMLTRAKFTGVKLKNVKMNMTDLKETTFENCSFDGVDFLHCDLRGQHFEGMTFTGTNFDRSSLNNVSFKGAVLNNVSFTPPFSVTNKSYLAMKTICFDGATMDKLTYAALKGLRVIDLSKVIVV